MTKITPEFLAQLAEHRRRKSAFVKRYVEIEKRRCAAVFEGHDLLDEARSAGINPHSVQMEAGSLMPTPPYLERDE